MRRSRFQVPSSWIPGPKPITSNQEPGTRIQMSFILKMAWRDSRASRRRLLLFSASIILGIAALVAIGSFSTNLQQAVQDQAKGLLGADLVIVGRTAPSAGVQDYLRSVGAEIAREQMFSSMAVFP